MSESPEAILKACGFSFLDNGTAPKVLQEMLRNLADASADFDDVTRATVREALVARLTAAGFKSPARLADAALNPPRAASGEGGNDKLQGQSIVLRVPEPWKEPVDGAALLDEIRERVRQYVILPKWGAETIALWVIHTYLILAFFITPRLTISSPEKRCGKTTLLEILGYLVCKPVSASNITASAVFRTIEKYEPTLLVDEADTFVRNADLRGILNSGHNRATSQVIRTAGEDFEPRLFSTFSPVCIALIGKLADTLEDRSIILPMKRKTTDEVVKRFRSEKVLAELEPIGRKAARWAKDHGDINEDDPQVPSELDDRKADCWRPLLAIADLAGGVWPEDARNAAVALSEESDEADSSVGIQLLTDIKALFHSERRDKLTSTEIVAALTEMEDRPWPEWGYKIKKPITTQQIAKLLKPFGIKPKVLRFEGITARGYELAWFMDAFSRYIPCSGGVTPSQPNNDRGFSDSSPVTDTQACYGSENGSNPHKQGNVTGVTGPEAKSRDEGEDAEIF